MAGYPRFEQGPEPAGYGDEKVSNYLESLQGSTLSREDLLSDLQAEVDKGKLTTEDAFSIAVEAGAIPRQPES